ncbi:hypothetical protein [Zymobacter palmae]|uniref:hypothetical protein n=1 Tax=Zymobacter palmae TaxID=33074 RepID=UPI0011AE6555|nr:hypothetical protein [Zymobacter palmae]
MNVTFHWKMRFSDDAIPYAISDALSNDGLDFIGCLFSDSGGAKYDDPVYVELLEGGIYGIELVKKGGVKYFDWCLSYWGAEFEENMARVYSLCDENFFINVKLDDFEKVLIDWKKFVSKGPLDNNAKDTLDA